MDRFELGQKLDKVYWDNRGISDRWAKEAMRCVAGYVLDNYVSKEVLREFVSHDILREWLDVCMPLQNMDKRVAFFKSEILRLKEIEKHYQEHIKNCNVFGNETKPEDKPKKIESIEVYTMTPLTTIKINELIDAANYLLERSK